mmetsp:Transcript_47575/g.132272  ORF Transcript_47575/g.132272 Transcript_47575/m.132272 type:complete len:323 (+) Transcript_47575:651-1619(+)
MSLTRGSLITRTSGGLVSLRRCGLLQRRWGLSGHAGCRLLGRQICRLWLCSRSRQGRCAVGHALSRSRRGAGGGSCGPHVAHALKGMDLAAGAHDGPAAVPGEEVRQACRPGAGLEGHPGRRSRRLRGLLEPGLRGRCSACLGVPGVIAFRDRPEHMPKAGSSRRLLLVAVHKALELGRCVAVRGVATVAPEAVEPHVLRLQLSVQLPEVVVVRAPHIVGQLVDQCVYEVVVWPEALQVVGPKPQHNHLAGVLVIPEEVHVRSPALGHPLLGFGGAHLCQDPDLELARLHDVDDPRVRGKLLEKALGLIRRRLGVLEFRLDG